MLLADTWQDGLIEQMRALLEPDNDVLALVVFGSWVTPELKDRFSDVDVMLVVRDGAGGRFFPSVDWLSSVGPLFATERSTYERSGAHRVCFEDGRRLDVVVVEEAVIDGVEGWAQHPLRPPRRIIFSRSSATDRAVASVYEDVPARLPSDEQFAHRVNAFWFEAQLAAHKALRGDLLVATHLHLGLVQSCLELAMSLRDRAADTHYHRHGAITDAATLTRLTRAPVAAAPTVLIEAIDATAELFDDLASEWDPAYRRRSGVLKPMISAVQAEITRGASAPRSD